MTRRNNLLEVLSPAGNAESVTAAVLNGADAVYLGQKSLNARQNADNFTEEAFVETIRYCHLHRVKVYQTLNTVVFDEELPLLKETVRLACKAGVDALIVQDFGVLRLLKEWCPEMRIHASTQMSVHTVKGAMLLKELGVKRVVLARELSREQIREIAERTGLETEMFVHGALCMSVSGQCYLSAMIGGRSGNKGSCAGTCRLPFTSVKGRERYDLSLKDNCLAERFGELEDLGVASLKIEGRMKRPEYVAAATAAYAALRDGRHPDLSLLRAVFSRSGFTDGYFTGKTGTEMFGVRQKEDVLSATGDVLRSLRETYRKEKPCRPVSMQFILKKEIPAKLIAKCGGCSAEVSGEVPQAALNRPITEITARESFSKLGGTVYFLETLSCEIEEGLILPKSGLNELRRAVVEKLNLLCGSPEPVPFLERDISLPSEHQPSGKSLRARFEHASQIPEQVWEEAELIYLPVGEVLRHTETLLPYSGKIILEPDRLMAGTEERTVSQCGVLAGKGFRRLAVSNPAHLQIGKDLGMALHGTAFLNCTNSFSALQYQELGLSDLILSFENTAKRMDRIKGSLPFGYLSYGRLPLMLLKNCPVQGGQGCKACRKKGCLTDRTGAEFPVLCHQKEYQELLNSRLLWVLDREKEFSRMDFSVLYFTTESKAECERVLKASLNGKKPDGEFTRGLYYRGLQ